MTCLAWVGVVGKRRLCVDSGMCDLRRVERVFRRSINTGGSEDGDLGENRVNSMT